MHDNRKLPRWYHGALVGSEECGTAVEIDTSGIAGLGFIGSDNRAQYWSGFR